LQNINLLLQKKIYIVKKILVVILVSMVFINYSSGKQHNGSAILQNKNNSKSAYKISINFELISNYYHDKSQLYSKLTVANHGKASIGNNWILYFNFSAGRDIMEVQNDNFKIEHINGDFYKMYPSEIFKTLKSRDSMVIPIIASNWMTKETDFPSGFYFVFNSGQKDEKIIIPEFKAKPLTKKEQINRTKDDLLEIPDAENRYFDNIDLYRLPKEIINKIIPIPRYQKPVMSRMKLNNSFKIIYDQGLKFEADYLSKALEKNLGFKLDVLTNSVAEQSNIFLKSGKVEIENKTYISGDEAYMIDIQNKNIIIAGTDAAGVFYGIQSLRSLLPVEAYKEPKNEIILDGQIIKDAPSLKYRGMMLDLARNFQDKKSVLNLIDIMSFYKMNKLHLHLSDDEGWRLQFASMPELTDVAAKRGHTLTEHDMLIPAHGSGPFPDSLNSSGTGYYTEQEFIDLIKYAHDRHIEIIPEIDLPGHSRAAIMAMKSRYEKYKASGDVARAEVFMNFDPEDKSIYKSVQDYDDNVVCVCQKSTYQFIEWIIDELSRMFKKGGTELKTMHLGGDEVPKGVWTNSPACVKLKMKNPELNNVSELKKYFFDNVYNMLYTRGITMAGWEEIAFTHDPSDNSLKIENEAAHKNMQVHSWNSVYGWGGEENAYRLANSGVKTIISNVTPFYLDMAYDKDPMEPGLYWGGYNTEKSIFTFDPYNLYSSYKSDNYGNRIDQSEFNKKVKLTEEGRKNIYGIQAQLWTETVKSRDRMEYMIFPRLIVVADKAWSINHENKTDSETIIKDWNKFANTLAQRELPRLDYLFGGINYRIPLPGAIMRGEKLFSNISLPGLDIHFTIDGSDPTELSPKYNGPVIINGKQIKLRTFTASGKSGRVVTIQN
jgi:hexosaminidase